jgi:hypothetical protein
MGFRRRSVPDTTPVTETKSLPPSKAVVKGKKRFIKAGAILEKKDGGVYLKFDENFDLTGLALNGSPVTGLQIEDPTAKFDRMVTAGKLTEKEADEKAANVPSYVLFEVTLVTE